MSPQGLAGTATPAHVYQHHERNYPGLFGRCQLPQNLMAVTAACMMVSTADYARVGGMTEDFAVAYNDVDFCFKLREEGLLITYTPYAELYHHESISRGTDAEEATHARRAQYERERGLLLTRWSDIMCEVDPYFGTASQVII